MSPQRRFPALRAAVVVLKVLAWIGAIAFLLVAFVSAIKIRGLHDARPSLMALGLALLTWVSGMLIPELIELLLAIEENTRPTHLEQEPPIELLPPMDASATRAHR